MQNENLPNVVVNVFQDLADPVSVAALCISSKRRDEIFIPFFSIPMPLFGRGSELLPIWPPALLFLLVLPSATRAVMCFLSTDLCPRLKPLQKFPTRLKARPNRAWLKPVVDVSHSLKNCSLKWSTNVFKLNLSSRLLSRPVNVENLFISPLSCYLRKGTADGALYIFITTPLPTPTHYLTPKSLLWPDLAFLLHLVLYSWSLDELLVKCFAEVLQAVLTHCSPFSGGFLCP